MKRSFLTIVIASALLTAAPASVFAQAKAAPAATAAKAGTPSQLVLANSTRILTTLEARRGEFTKNRAALRAFVASEFDALFDRDYAARLVLGVHGRGAPEADIDVFADALADSLMQRYGSSLLDLNAKLKVRVKSETPLRGGAIVKDSRRCRSWPASAGWTSAAHSVSIAPAWRCWPNWPRVPATWR